MHGNCTPLKLCLNGQYRLKSGESRILYLSAPDILLLLQVLLLAGKTKVQKCEQTEKTWRVGEYRGNYSRAISEIPEGFTYIDMFDAN